MAARRGLLLRIAWNYFIANVKDVGRIRDLGRMIL
jgi:hypothetical protein